MKPFNAIALFAALWQCVALGLRSYGSKPTHALLGGLMLCGSLMYVGVRLAIVAYEAGRREDEPLIVIFSAAGAISAFSVYLDLVCGGSLP